MGISHLLILSSSGGILLVPDSTYFDFDVELNERRLLGVSWSQESMCDPDGFPSRQSKRRSSNYS